MISKTEIMKSTLQAGSFGQIRLSVHWTFILVIVWLAAINLFAETSVAGLIWSLIVILSLLSSILVHDIAQASVAAFFNIKISRLILLPTGGLPSISNKPKKEWQEIVMLTAGPAANLIVAGVLMIFLRPYLAYWNEPENIGVGYAGNFLFQLQFINLSLGLLNILPVFPMDGGRMLDSLLEKRYKTEKSVKLVNLISIGSALIFIITSVLTLEFALLLIGFFILFTIPLGKYYHPVKKVVNWPE
jgi:Zn-dependent protease